MSQMDTMLREARAALENAHCPYSRFPVGACLRTPSGLYSGGNVESASFPEGICAESSAIGAMVRAGEREIQEVLVLSLGPEPCSPCGGCRQRLSEFGTAATPIHICGPEGHLQTLTLGELLPLAFHGKHLRKSG